MQKFLPLIVILVAAIAGGGGGFFFKMQSSAKSAGETEHTAIDGEQGEETAHKAVDGHDSGDDHGKDDHGKKDKKKKKGGHGEEAAGATTYMKFSRQFVVPVVRDGRPKTMVILDLNIEIDNSLDESVYTLEPPLRDALLSRMLTLAADGMLPQMLEEGDKLEATKAALLETSRAVIGDAARNVLILDIGIQSY